jgi:murein DD-endopeptidase MepM/ murein hydrolase activator NlpD
MRIRPAGIAVIAVAAFAIGLTVPAQAEPDLSSRRHNVDQTLDQLREDLSETSQQLVGAAVALRKAEAELPGAKAAAAKARQQLAIARAKDREAAANLAAAEAAERKAERELAAVNARITARRQYVGRVANTAYREGGLSQLAMILESESPDDFAARVAAVQSIAQAQNSVLRDLATDRADLVSSEARLAALRGVAAHAREEARKQLARTQVVEQRARAAEQRVSRLVRDRRAAFAAVAQEKADEERRIAALEHERSTISAELAARAAAAHARALRAASASAGGGGGGGGGGSVGTGALSRPLNGPVTSPYGMRLHPITHIYKLHDGTDFGGGCGTPIHAAASGQVIWAKYRGGYGYQLAIDHGVVRGISLVTSYSHMPAGGFAVGVGTRVGRGQVIGYVGATGYATGCHLHFMTYEDGQTVNPVRWL